MSDLTDEQRIEYGLSPKRSAEQALRDHHQALAAAHKIPEPWTTIADILGAVEERLLTHPRGLAGVADEMDVSRKNLWRWLRGMKVPDNSTLSKMARMLTTPIKNERQAIAIQTGVPIPPRSSYRFRGEGRKTKWLFVKTLKPGDYFEAAFGDRSNILSFAKSEGIKLVTRVLSRDRIGVWRRS